MTTLAHLGGVPEALTVLVPLALVVVMLRVGAKRMPPEPDDQPGEGPAGPAEAGPAEAGPAEAGPDPAEHDPAGPDPAGSPPP